MKVKDNIKNLEHFSGNSFEMICDIEARNTKKAGLKLRVGDEEETLLYLDMKEGKVVLDRTKSGVPFATDYGMVRKKKYEKSNVCLHIFMDISSIEVFVNDGEIVFTSRLFPAKDSNGIQFFSEEGLANMEVVQWKYD